MEQVYFSQVWLVLLLLSLVSGFAFFVGLLILHRFLPGNTKSMLRIFSAYLLMLGVATASIYLKILEISRATFFLRCLHSFAWAFFFWTLLPVFLKKKGRIILGLVSVFSLGIFVMLFWKGPFSSESPGGINFLVMGVIEILFSFLALRVGILLFRQRKNQKSPFWQQIQGAFAVVLIVLPGIEFLDFFRSIGMKQFGISDGFFFAIGATVVNVLFLVGLFRGLKAGKQQKRGQEISLLADFYKLTPREKEVACLLFRGKTNKAIAEELFISVRTVDSHVSNLLKKCGAGNRLELIRCLENPSW